MIRFACVILVDRRGRVLLQERDEHAPIAPERWGLTGGHIEPGEEQLPAAVRELEEETGLRIRPEALTLAGVFEVDHVETGSTDRLAVYAAAVDLTDDDIDCREGRRIVFVDPADVRSLRWADSLRRVLPAFLDSQLYRRLGSPDAPIADVDRVGA